MKKLRSYGILLIVVFSCTTQETATFERFYFRTDRGDLAVEINGNIASGTFIVLLHGGPGGGSQDYNTGTYAEMLESRYAMVYLDQRGQGASKGKYDESDITLQQFSDDIYNVTRLLRAKYDTAINVFLLGHSWGGLTGTHALLNTGLQAQIQGWIEADGAHDIPLLNRELIQMILEIGGIEIAAGRNPVQWQKWIDYVNALDPDNISLDESVELNYIADDAEQLIDEVFPPEEGTYGYGIFQNPDWSMAVWLSNLSTADAIEIESESARLTGQLDQILVPTLLLWGKYDFVVPPALGDTANALIPDAELVVFANSGHSPMDNQPVDFAQSIIDFVEQNKVY